MRPLRAEGERKEFGRGGDRDLKGEMEMEKEKNMMVEGKVMEEKEREKRKKKKGRVGEERPRNKRGFCEKKI